VVANIKGATGAAGSNGTNGTNGTNGVGVPAGGTTGQILSKIDGTDYNTQWITGSGGGGLTLTQVTKTLTTGAWTLVSGLYEQDVSDAAITSVAVVDIIPDNADITTVKDAEILPKTVSASGSVKVYATNLPSADIGVTLNILK